MANMSRKETNTLHIFTSYRICQCNSHAVSSPGPNVPLYFHMQIETVARHPDYDPYTMVHDISLLRLKRKLRHTSAAHEVCLPLSYDSFVGENCTVTGWGYLSECMSPQHKGVGGQSWKNLMLNLYCLENLFVLSLLTSFFVKERRIFISTYQISKHLLKITKHIIGASESID